MFLCDPQIGRPVRAQVLFWGTADEGARRNIRSSISWRWPRLWTAAFPPRYGVWPDKSPPYWLGWVGAVPLAVHTGSGRHNGSGMTATPAVRSGDA